MAAQIQFKLLCDRTNPPAKPSLKRCLAWLVVPADGLTVARRYAAEENDWVSIQEGNHTMDYCPDCDPTKENPGDFLRLSVGRSTHRLVKNVPVGRRP